MFILFARALCFFSAGSFAASRAAESLGVEGVFPTALSPVTHVATITKPVSATAAEIESTASTSAVSIRDPTVATTPAPSQPAAGFSLLKLIHNKSFVLFLQSQQTQQVFNHQQQFSFSSQGLNLIFLCFIFIREERRQKATLDLSKEVVPSAFLFLF